MKSFIDIETTHDGLVLSDDLFILVPDFREISEKYGSKGVLWIVCLYDYWSPYRGLDIGDRKKIIAKDIRIKVGNITHIDADPLMKSAIKKYKDLQYDPILDSYNMMSTKIRVMNESIDSTAVTMDSIKTVQDALKGNEKINEMIMKMQNHIKESSKKSPFRGYVSIEDYHSIEH
jgi:hypothetical protein